MTQLILPFIILLIIIPPFIKKQNIFDDFIEGAGDGLLMLKNIFLPLIGIMTAFYMMRAAGIFDALERLLKPVFDLTGIPSDILSLILIRPFSGSGALGAFTDILTVHGADAPVSTAAAIIMGGSETTFYALCVYFSAVKAKQPKRLIAAALTADLTAAVIGVIIVSFMK